MPLPPLHRAQLLARWRSVANRSAIFQRVGTPCHPRNYSDQSQTSPKNPSSFNARGRSLPSPEAVASRYSERLLKDTTVPIGHSSKELIPASLSKKSERRREAWRVRVKASPPVDEGGQSGQVRPKAGEDKEGLHRATRRQRQKERAKEQSRRALMARVLGTAHRSVPKNAPPHMQLQQEAAITTQVAPEPQAEKNLDTVDSAASPPTAPLISPSEDRSQPPSEDNNQFGTSTNLSRQGKLPWIEDRRPWRPETSSKVQRKAVERVSDPDTVEAKRLKRQLEKAKRWEEVASLRLQLVEDRATALELGNETGDQVVMDAEARLAAATEAAEAISSESPTDRDVLDAERSSEEPSGEIDGYDNELVQEEQGAAEDAPVEEPQESERDPEKPTMRSKKNRISVAKGIHSSREIVIHEVAPLRDAPVATLGRGLQRVLFNPSIHYLSDPRTSVFNYEQSLASIPAVDEFAYDRCPQYITASKDPELLQMSEEHGTKYFGSTSTLTKALSQIYFAISGGKPVTFNNLSQEFTEGRTDFTAGAKLPASLVVKALPGGKYAVDNDKKFDVDENVLSDMGRVLEKMLTTEEGDFKRFLKSSPESAVSYEERHAREAYFYSKASKMLMRSQLDCHDPRLPGTGTFDIKTRACLPIRHDRANYIDNAEYDISRTHGFERSYEREYYDLVRSGMLKYSLQARIGNMDGIFVAYHNTRRMFGFQYLPLEEIDARLFGSTEMGDAAFKLSVSIVENILEQATGAFPDTSVFLTIDDTSLGADRRVTAWVSPEAWDTQAHTEQPIVAFVFDFQSSLNGKPVLGHVSFPDDQAARRETIWTIDYEISKTPPTPQGERTARNGLSAANRRLIGMQSLSVPEGKTVEEMYARDRLRSKIDAIEAESANPPLTSDELAEVVKVSEEQAFAAVRWREADGRIQALRMAALESGREYKEREERIVRERGYASPPLPSAHYTSQQAVEAAARRAGAK